MTCKVLRTIEENDLLSGVKSICIGVSGGADSVCLLDILLFLQPRFGFSLQVVHVNHGLRGEEAKRDADFVESLCKSRGVSFHLVEKDVASIAKKQRCSVEECGRCVRYAAFKSFGCDAIAVAHTLNDSLETALFHLMRGSSVRGAAGIPAKNGKVIRPLIDCTRSEVEAYLKQHHLRFVQDSTNLQNDYTRNFIRNQILPPLHDRFPAMEQAFSRFRADALLQIDYMEQQASALLQRAQTADGYCVETLLQEHQAVLHAALNRILNEVMQKPPEQKHILLCVDALEKGNDRVSLGKDLLFSVKQGLAYLESVEPTEPWCVPIASIPSKIETPFGCVSIRKAAKEDFAFYPKSSFIDQPDSDSLLLRSRKPGDRFCYDQNGHTKTVKKLMNEKKIPAYRRDRLAVLCCGSEIAWIESIGASAAFRLKKDTETALLIETERKQNDVI